METENRPAVELTNSLLTEGSVIIARRNNGKLYAVEPYTREELQAIVQQANDLYGITADPFATPGSLEAPAVDHSRCQTAGAWYGVPQHAFAVAP